MYQTTPPENHFLNVWGEVTREHGETVPARTHAELLWEHRDMEQAVEKSKEGHDNAKAMYDEARNDMCAFIRTHYDMWNKRNEDRKFYPLLPLEQILDDKWGLDKLMESVNLITEIMEENRVAAVEEFERITEEMQEMANKAVAEVAAEELQVLQRENADLRFWIECRVREDEAKEAKKAKAKAKKAAKESPAALSVEAEVEEEIAGQGGG